MMPKMMFRPMVVTMMKKEISYNSRHPNSLISFEISGIAFMRMKLSTIITTAIHTYIIMHAIQELYMRDYTSISFKD